MLMGRYTGNTEHAADLIRFPDTLSESESDIESHSRSCIFVGTMHNAPYFLDLGASINPHVFICGITGSGKTYLMRNLMLKLWALDDATVLVPDFTGEYEAFTSFTGETCSNPENADKLLRERKGGILYFNMKGIATEQARVKAVERIMDTAVKCMRANAGGGRVFLVLDEAWKLLKGSTALKTLLREGRKYGYGLLFSSQLLEDIDFAMLSNAATVFLFRLQNKHGLERLAANYGLASRHIDVVQNLAVGSCMVIQSLATGRRSACLIERVHGIDMEGVVHMALDGKMKLEIGRHKFEECIRRNCGAEALEAALALNGSEARIELAKLVALLLKHCSGDTILAALRGLAVDEESLADAFASALTMRGDASED